jgi:hypothetical protein
LVEYLWWHPSMSGNRPTYGCAASPPRPDRRSRSVLRFESAS